MTAHHRHGRRRLLSDLTRLEDRCTPALFGVPWADPMHLSLSFAPDGTTAAGEPSQLLAALDAAMPRAAWQGADASGPPRPGPRRPASTSGSSRTAASRSAPPAEPRRTGGSATSAWAGSPWPPPSLAVAIPPDPYLTGSFAGDVFVNTRRPLTPDLLYAVALHEIGHALGLPPSADPNVGDVQHRRPDPHHPGRRRRGRGPGAVRDPAGRRRTTPSERNDTANRATRLDDNQGRGSFDGSTPAVGYGDVTTRSDVDVFTVRGLNNYRGPMTVRVQTAGVSLLAPQVTVTDERGRVLGRATGSGVLGSVLEVKVPRTVPGERYFVRVGAAPGTGSRSAGSGSV